MKPLRIIHLLFGLLAVIPVAYLASALILPPFQSAESLRIESLAAQVGRSVETYHQARGHYPDTIEQALTLAGTPRGLPAEPEIRKMGYSHTDCGFEFSYTGRWYRYTLKVTNDSNGNRSSATAMVAR